MSRIDGDPGELENVPRALVMLRRGRTPVQISMAVAGIAAVAVPWFLGAPGLAAVGVVILVVLGESLRAIDDGPAAVRRLAHGVYALTLGGVAYAVFVVGIAPVITVYFPALVLLASAHMLGARAALIWTVPSIALVAAAVFLPLPPAREVGEVITFVVRAGTLATILSIAVSFRRSHDRQAAQLERLATTDALTGLANRIELRRAFKQALGRSRRFDRRGAVVFVDIDGMKSVNDTLGHNAGDAFLSLIAARIRSVTREVDMPARIGGDEFVILLSEFDDPKGASIFARKLLGCISAPCEVSGKHMTPSASVGIALFPESACSEDEVLHLADAAMYAAKRAGGGQIYCDVGEGPRELH